MITLSWSKISWVLCGKSRTSHNHQTPVPVSRGWPHGGPPPTAPRDRASGRIPLGAQSMRQRALIRRVTQYELGGEVDHLHKAQLRPRSDCPLRGWVEYLDTTLCGQRPSVLSLKFGYKIERRNRESGLRFCARRRVLDPCCGCG